MPKIHHWKMAMLNEADIENVPEAFRERARYDFQNHLRNARNRRFLAIRRSKYTGNYSVEYDAVAAREALLATIPEEHQPAMRPHLKIWMGRGYPVEFLALSKNGPTYCVSYDEEAHRSALLERMNLCALAGLAMLAAMQAECPPGACEQRPAQGWQNWAGRA